MKKLRLYKKNGIERKTIFFKNGFKKISPSKKQVTENTKLSLRN